MINTASKVKYSTHATEKSPHVQKIQWTSDLSANFQWLLNWLLHQLERSFLLTNLKLKTLADVLADSCNIKFSDKASFYSQAVKITQLERKLMQVDSPPYATHTTTENKQYIKHQLSLRERGTP